MNKYTKRFWAGALTATLLCSPLSSFATETGLRAQETIAGLGTIVEAAGYIAGTNGAVAVTPPVGPDVVLPIAFDTNGNGSAAVAGKDTEIAGTYRVSLKQGTTVLAETTFEVFPDTVDPKNASIEAPQTTLRADGEEELPVTVILRDRYDNPLPGRSVEVISSRSSDVIAAVTRETDANGEQHFTLRSTKEGMLTLRAIDLLGGTVLETSIDIMAGDIAESAGGYYAPAPAMAAQPMYMPYPAYNPYPAYAPGPYPPSYGSNLTSSLLGGRKLYGQVADFDVLSGFEILAPKQLEVNEYATITIRALDATGRTVEDYTGHVLLSSTDPDAFLPLNGEIDFRPQDLGEKTLTLGLLFQTPSTSEPHILMAQDSADPSIQGMTEIDVTGSASGPGGQLIVITSHQQDGPISSMEIILEGTAPPYVNLIVTGGKEDASGDTNGDGVFSIPVSLNEGQIDHTLRVRDESGRYDSGNLHLVLDTTPLEIPSISFAPASPVEGTDVLFIAKTEPAATVTLTIGTEEYPVTEVSTESGTYQVLFTAPAAGIYQPTVSAADAAGNATEIRTNLVIAPKGLPQVKNLVAEAQASAILLTWDPVTDVEVDAYRVYVGEQPDDFIHSLDTDEPVASATVAGLSPGATYYFAVTAIQGDQESAEKSDSVEAQVLGMTFDVTEQDSSLLLEWSAFQDGVPLSSYLLEYGVVQGSYTEQRTLNGELNAYMLRDLLNDVPYYLRLTPITTTGEVLRDLAATGHGTPKGEKAGFHPAAAELAPFAFGPGTGGPMSMPPPGSDLHKGAPLVSTTGIPLPAWWIVALTSGFLVFLFIQHRRSMRNAMDFVRVMERTYDRKSS